MAVKVGKRLGKIIAYLNLRNYTPPRHSSISAAIKQIPDNETEGIGVKEIELQEKQPEANGITIAKFGKYATTK